MDQAQTATNGAVTTPPAANGTPTAIPSPSTPLGGVVEQRGVHMMTERTIAELKRKAEKKGSEQAMNELNQLASKFGFNSLEDAFAAIANGGRSAAPANGNRPNGNGNSNGKATTSRASPRPPEPPEPPAPPSNRNDRKAWARYERDRQQWQEKNRQYQARIANLAERERQARAERDALDAEMQLQRVAMQAGVKDIDYAVYLYQKRLASLSEEQLAQLDHSKFFSEELRKTNPYLYGSDSASVVTRPATTGTGAGADVTPPGPAAAAAAAAQADLKQARDMKPDEFEATLRKLGINKSIPSR